MTTAGFAGAWRPIDDDEAETHYHKQEAYPSKTAGLEERGSGWVLIHLYSKYWPRSESDNNGIMLFTWAANRIFHSHFHLHAEEQT